MFLSKYSEFMERLPKNIKIPDVPGVYFFKQGRKVLYIGKATSLRDRVRSYFANDLMETRGPLLVKMLQDATDLKWQTTDSVLEALIWESKLIRKYQPPFNTDEKDNKSFNHVVITDEDFPRILVVREHDLLNGATNLEDIKIKYEFGPFPSGGSLKAALGIIRKIFPFRDRASSIKHNERFYQQIGLAPDTSSTEAKREYQKTIRNIRLFFEGKKQKLIKLLEREMRAAAGAQEFEKADEIKRQVFALQHIQDIALITRDTFLRKSASSQRFSATPRVEAYDIAHTSGVFVVGVMTVVEEGLSNKSQYRKFKIKESPGINDTKALREVLERRLGHPEWPMPRIIVVDGGKAQLNIAERVLRSYGVGIPVVAVIKDERHRAKKILGDQKLISEYESDILLANAEAHRFAVSYHRQKRGKLST